MSPERKKEIRQLIDEARSMFSANDVRGLAPELDLANGAAELFDEIDRLQTANIEANKAFSTVMGNLIEAIEVLDDAHAFIASLNCNEFSTALENERCNLEMVLHQTLKELKG